MKRLCVFCGSSTGVSAAYKNAAVELGQVLAASGIALVYGGGAVGLMGVLADAVLAEGGEAIGVIPQDLVKKEVAHKGLTKLHVVKTMHERKALMEELSDGFVALPGGFGTLDEFCEIVTWVQLGIHQKPVGVLNVGGYFDGFLSFIDYAVRQGFIQPELRDHVFRSGDISRLLEDFKTHRPFVTTKWLKTP